jgi:hypothetical protein
VYFVEFYFVCPTNEKYILISFLDIGHFLFLIIYNFHVRTGHFVEFYDVCQTNTHYILTSIVNRYRAFVRQI